MMRRIKKGMKKSREDKQIKDKMEKQKENLKDGII
jgi:hypothetical protein